MKVNPSEFTGSKLPVERVTCHETVAFCESINKKKGIGGWKFDLPTEAQWKYVCRTRTSIYYSCGTLLVQSQLTIWIVAKT